MVRKIRILVAVALTVLVLLVAQWAVRDCRVAPLVYENCIWLAVRDSLHLPQSKVLRGAVLEIVGLTLAAGLFAIWLCVFPRRKRSENRAMSVSEILPLELGVLRALCQGGVDRGTAQALLASYRWRDQVHQVIYQIATAKPGLSSEVLRQQLPARLTNAGFPDFPWEEFLRPQDVSKDEAERMLRELAQHST